MGSSDDVATHGWMTLTVIATAALMAFGALFLGARFRVRGAHSR
jgi:hypothetical protein